MKYFYVIASLDKGYVQEAQVFAKAYLEVKGAECLLHHIPERTRRGAYIGGAQVPEDMECVVTIGGDDTLIQAARDLAGRNVPMLGVNQGHLGYLNQVSRQESIAPVLESLLDGRYQLEWWMMTHGTVQKKEEVLLKDIVPSEIVITRKNPLKAFRYSAYIDDKYLNEYAVGGVPVTAPTGSTAYNLPTGGPVIAPRVRMIVLTPICSHPLSARSTVLTPKDRVRIKVFDSGQVVSLDGDMSTGLRAGDYIDVRCSESRAVMIKLKQISFMQNLSNHLGELQIAEVAEHYKSARREASHMKIRRHSRIVELVEEYEIETQGGLVERLNEVGFNVTQAAVSRDVHELELIRMQSKGGRQRYVVLENPRRTSVIKYIHILKDGYMSTDMAQNILVTKTVSGMVIAVAAALDAIQFHGIVGCIAGDDTIVYVIRSVDDIVVVVGKIKKMMEG